MLEDNRHFFNTLLGLFTSLDSQYLERNGRWLDEDEWWMTTHIYLLSSITLYISGNLSETDISKDNFLAQPKTTTDVEFVSWVAEQLDKILNRERPIRYPDIEEIWRARIGEIGQFCRMWLGNRDMDVSIH